MGKIYKLNQLNQFNKDLRKHAMDALAKDLGRECYNIMKKWLFEEVYNKSTPSSYERTYKLLNSLQVSPVVDSGNKVSIKIYISNEVANDSEHLMRYDVNEMNLNYGDEPTLSEVMLILEKGLNPYRPDALVIENTVEELKSTGVILKRLMAYLKSRGFNIV